MQEHGENDMNMGIISGTRGSSDKNGNNIRNTERMP